MRVTCLGDSFTEGFLVENNNYTRFLQEAGFKIVNLGINGSQTDDMLQRYEAYLMRGNVDQCLIVFGGTNDFYNGKSIDSVLANLESILNTSKAELKILLIPPLLEVEEAFPRYELINQKINGLAERINVLDGVVILDTRKIPASYIDGIHMRASFHKGLARQIIEILGGKVDRITK